MLTSGRATLRVFFLSLWLASGATVLLASDADDDAIHDLLAAQVESWNHGKLDEFATAYAEDCTFVSKELLHGKDKMMARYRKTYPGIAAMGKLTFTNIEVRELGEHVATATGTWHLDRTAEAGGNTGGYFSLVLKNVDDEWKIMLDHTTALPSK